jgi:LysM repeat protein
VRKGDTAESVADDFGVPVAKLRSWNGLKGNTLKVGRVLSIHKPLATTEGSATASSKNSKSRAKSAQAAENESDTPAPCTKWGRKNGKRVCLARAKKSEPSAQTSKGTSAKVVHHTVQKGETLSSIATKYNITVAALKRDNRSVTADLKPGRVLVIKSGD